MDFRLFAYQEQSCIRVLHVSLLYTHVIQVASTSMRTIIDNDFNSRNGSQAPIACVSRRSSDWVTRSPFIVRVIFAAAPGAYLALTPRAFTQRRRPINTHRDNSQHSCSSRNAYPAAWEAQMAWKGNLLDLAAVANTSVTRDMNK